jgi:hypothetical protein
MDIAQSGDEEKAAENSVNDYVWHVLYAIRGSFSIFLIALGILCTILGIALQTGSTAGMLVIWGATALVYGVVIRIVMRIFTI